MQAKDPEVKRGRRPGPITAVAAAAVVVAMTAAVAVASLPAQAQAEPGFNYETQITGQGTPEGVLQAPVDVSVDEQGRLYVVENEADRVRIFGSFSEDNVPTQKSIGGTAPLGCGNEGELDRPWGVSVDPGPAHHVYVADSDNSRIQVFNGFAHGSGFVKSLPFAEVCDGDQGDDFKDSLTLLRVETFTPGYAYVPLLQGGGIATNFVAVIDLSLNTPGEVAFLGYVGWFGLPLDVAVDPGGRVYVADLLNNRISVFTGYDFGNKLLGVFGEYGTGPGKLNHPAGLATDSLGRVYVAESGGPQGGGRIQVFSSFDDGNNVPIASLDGVSTPNGYKELGSPVGITVDGTRVYVADTVTPIPPNGKPEAEGVVWRLRFDDADGDNEFDPPPSGKVPDPGAGFNLPAGAVPGGSPVPVNAGEAPRTAADRTGPYSRITRPRARKLRRSKGRRRARGSTAARSLNDSSSLADPAKRSRSARRSIKLRRLRRVAGYAVDRESGVAGVKVAIFTKRSARCRGKSKRIRRGKSKRARRCRRRAHRSKRRAKRSRKRCLALTRRRLRRRSCKRPPFLKAKLVGKASRSGKRRWVLRLTRLERRALRSGRYEIRSRAIDRAGNSERRLRRGKNRVRVVLRKARKRK